MSANIPAHGDPKTLDLIAEPEQPLTEQQMSERSTLVHLFRSLLKDVGTLKRRWAPNRIDFEDRAVLGDGTTKYRFKHSLGGPVRFWPVSWVGAASPNLRRDTASDDNTLVLTSTSEGLVTLRVEEAG
jgi:hypothetical protein